MKTVKDLAGTGPSEDDYAAVLEQSRRRLEEFAHDNRLVHRQRDLTSSRTQCDFVVECVRACTRVCV